ncbi:MAG: cysteine desulfurase family protein [Terrimicrobiaceae bacterium]|nr:cysteine desulfurase family protein [Terrimicrobiaceae bacterium]
MVYLDYNATTPLDPAVRDEIVQALDAVGGNPSSVHAAGRRARALIDDARDRLAAVLRARPHEIIFTAGGTESCNLGVIGLARAHAPQGRHLITSAIEHHAVLHACEHLAHFEGFELTVLPVDATGVVDPERLAAAIRPDTTVVSIMHANNETGTIQPLGELAKTCRDRGVFFHTDAIQTFGKLPVPELDQLSALSLTAHKFYGPVGAGALWLGSGIALAKTSYGGAHENTRRPGTENVAAIVGLAAAAERAIATASTESRRLEPLRETLWTGISAAVPSAIRNGNPAQCLANTLNVSFPGCDGEALLMGLDLEGLCVSSGSACMVGSVQPSHVLLAMGVPPAHARATIRFSLGQKTSPEDIARAIEAVRKVVHLSAAK